MESAAKPAGEGLKNIRAAPDAAAMDIANGCGQCWGGEAGLPPHHGVSWLFVNNIMELQEEMR